VPTSRAPPAAAAAVEALPALRDLPAPLRAELPPLVVAGAMHSPDPSSRMIVVDGQVLREGQSLRADLVLERIGPRSAVFSHRGQRFELPF
jgi:general secretion pathway protein B